MSRYAHRRWLLTLSTFIVLLLAFPENGRATTKQETARALERSAQTRTTMHAIFAAMSRALSASFDEQRFSSLAERVPLESALKDLAANASELGKHAAGWDEGFAFLSRSLATDARDVERRFRAGQFPEARFLLRSMTETCITCHSRLPATRNFPGAASFFKDIDVAKLPAEEKARLQMAMRQFDAALSTFEAMFAQPSYPGPRLALDNAVSDYLVICIRVERDMARAETGLEQLAKRRDLPLYLRGDIAQWRASLTSLRRLPEPTMGPGFLDAARKRIEEGQKLSQFPLDHRGLVYDLLASSYLHRFLDETHGTRLEQAEAYYLLGIVEERSTRSFWLSQTPHFLETSIRLAPRAPFARAALDQLEEHVLLEYSGSSGISIPDDVAADLQELRDLVLRDRSGTP